MKPNQTKGIVERNPEYFYFKVVEHKFENFAARERGIFAEAICFNKLWCKDSTRQQVHVVHGERHIVPRPDQASLEWTHVLRGLTAGNLKENSDQEP